MKIFLALPAYNEEQALPVLLRSLDGQLADAGYPLHVVVVDDGSQDGTADVVRRWRSETVRIDLVRHSVNCGLGETVRDALRYASELADSGDVIVTMDADNTHSPSLIPAMIERLRDKEYDIVIASRYRSGARVVGLSPIRRLTSYGARALFQLVLPIRGVRDYTCGFRAYRAEIIQKAFQSWGDNFVEERSFACMAEILLKVREMRVRICEVPMVLRYDQKGGASKMRVGVTIVKTLALIARARFRISIVHSHGSPKEAKASRSTRAAV
jgi:dolichol-phosphate mannosyltransferase